MENMTQREIDQAFAEAHAERIGYTLAACDLCGFSDNHSHTMDEYGLAQDPCRGCHRYQELDADGWCDDCAPDECVEPQIFGIRLD